MSHGRPFTRARTERVISNSCMSAIKQYINNALFPTRHQKISLSLLQAGLDPSSEGLATQVLCLHLALFSTTSTSITSTHKYSMLYFMTPIHLFLCLPLLRCPHISASKILLTQSSSSQRCTCPNHLNLASCTLSVIRHKKLEIWGKAQCESTRRPKCDWGKLRGVAKFPRHQSHVARTQMHWHTPNAHCRLRLGQY